MYDSITLGSSPPASPSNRKLMRSNTFNLFPNTPKNLQRTHTQLVPHLIKTFSLEVADDLEIIIDTLRKSPNLRTDEDNRLLKAAFQEVRFFIEIQNELPEELIIILYKELKYEYFNRRQTVFEISQTGTKFYIILQGTIYVLVPKKGLQFKEEKGLVQREDEDELQDKEKEEQTNLLRRFRENLKSLAKSVKTNTKEYTENDREYIKKHIKKYKKIEEIDPKTGRCKLGSDFLSKLTDADYVSIMYPDQFIGKEMSAGDSFGEVALRRAIPRTATILCKQDTHFAILTKKSFNEILNLHYQKKNQENILFINSIPFFKTWKPELIEQICFQLITKRISKGAYIFKEGDPSTDIYIIKEGEVELILEKKAVKIASLTVGHIFGYEDIFLNSERKFSAKVNNSTVIFQITKQKFFTFVKDEKTLKNFRENSIILNNFRDLQAANFSLANKAIESDLLRNKITPKQNSKKASSQEVGTYYYKNKIFRLKLQNKPLNLSSLPNLKLDEILPLTHRSKELERFNEKKRIFAQKAHSQIVDLSKFNNENLLFSERKTVIQKGKGFLKKEDQNSPISRKNIGIIKTEEGQISGRNGFFKNEESQCSKLSKNKRLFEKITKQRDSIGAYIKNYSEKVERK